MTTRKHMRRYTALSAVLAISFAAAACGSDDDTSTVTDEASPASDASTASSDAPAGGGSSDDQLLYVIYKQGTQQYFVEQGEGAQAAADELGAELRIVNVESDGNLAITAMQDAISGGATGIGITVPDQTIGPRVAELAAEAGIPVVATDDSIEDGDGNPVAFVGFDGNEMGQKTGQAAVEALNESGWLDDDSATVGLLSVEKQDLSACNDRTDEQKRVVEEAGVDASNVHPVASDASIDGALSASSPVITAAGDITNWVVTGCNDESVKGGINALLAAGFTPDQIIGVGLGAYEACKDWQAGGESGFKSALYISGRDVGDAAVRALYANAVDGTPLPEKTVAKTTIVDASNWEESGLVCA